MTKQMEVHNQKELDTALKMGADVAPILLGNAFYELGGNSRATLCGNSTATLCGNSTATLCGNSRATLWGNSTATLWDNSTATLRDNSTATLRGNSTATLCGNSTATLRDNSTATLWGNSTATLWDNSRATLRDNSRANASEASQLSAFDKSSIIAARYVAITKHHNTVKTKGGIVIAIPVVKTAKVWCEFYAVPIKKGVAVLFKAVGDDFQSSRGGVFYTPGTKPEAPDWDGGRAECGGGLHFSPCPKLAKSMNQDAKRFVACPIKVSEIKVHYPAQYPNKVKAPRVFGACYEVDIEGNRI